MDSLPVECTGCGIEVDPLDLFPRNRCLGCHAKAFDLKNALNPMTADTLSKMWGGK